MSESHLSLLALSRMGVRIQNLNRQFERLCGMSLVQWSALKHLMDLPGASAQELAATIGVHPSTLTQSLRRLEEKQYVFVDLHPADARRKNLVVTRKGKEAHDRLIQKLGSTLAKIDAVADQIRELDQVLETVVSPKPSRGD
jgi:DNA-binding MarR family transcriptional regulator